PPPLRALGCPPATRPVRWFRRPRRLHHRRFRSRRQFHLHPQIRPPDLRLVRHCRRVLHLIHRCRHHQIPHYRHHRVLRCPRYLHLRRFRLPHRHQDHLCQFRLHL